jgi:hypothetical protein
MKKLHKNQAIGIGMLFIGIAAYFFTENDITHVISGALSAIGAGYILKWIPLKSRSKLINRAKHKLKISQLIFFYNKCD